MKQTSETWRVSLPTSAGEFIGTFSPDGLVALDFPSDRGVVAEEMPAQIRSWAKATTAALERVLAGKAAGDLPPLALKSGTTFQRAVWKELAAIPQGQTRSYGELAERLGRRGAARAVGAACGANPVPVLIPCHRVLASNRRLGGFSGGLRWKIELLKREGVRGVMLPDGQAAL